MPKNICIKCYGSALNKYEDYQRIVKIQNKWINNVRKNQPSNPYIRMLDLMEVYIVYLIVIFIFSNNILNFLESEQNNSRSTQAFVKGLFL